MKDNEAFVNKDGIVEIIYHGDQTTDSVDRLVSNISKLIEARPGKIKYLIDMSDVGKATAASRKTVVSKIKYLKIEKQAIFGGNTYTKYLMNFMLKAINLGGKLQYFETRAEAEEWLNA